MEPLGVMYGTLAYRNIDKAVRLFPVLLCASLCALCLHPLDAGREVEKVAIDARWTKLARQAKRLQPS